MIAAGTWRGVAWHGEGAGHESLMKPLDVWVACGGAGGREHDVDAGGGDVDCVPFGCEASCVVPPELTAVEGELHFGAGHAMVL